MIMRVNRGTEAGPGSALWNVVGRRLKTRRIQIGFDIEDVAGKLAISSRAYEDYESGTVQAPAFLLEQIANLFGVPLLWFFQDIRSEADHDGDAAAGDDAPGVFTVATAEERVEALTDCFRKLDLEGQQHLLAIASALTRSK